jgi:colicin import membrane protein
VPTLSLGIDTLKRLPRLSMYLDEKSRMKKEENDERMGEIVEKKGDVNKREKKRERGGGQEADADAADRATKAAREDGDRAKKLAREEGERVKKAAQEEGERAKREKAEKAEKEKQQKQHQQQQQKQKQQAAEKAKQVAEKAPAAGALPFFQKKTSGTKLVVVRSGDGAAASTSSGSSGSGGGGGGGGGGGAGGAFIWLALAGAAAVAAAGPVKKFLRDPVRCEALKDRVLAAATVGPLCKFWNPADPHSLKAPCFNGKRLVSNLEPMK